MSSTDCVISTFFIRKMNCNNCFLYVTGLLTAFAYGMALILFVVYFKQSSIVKLNFRLLKSYEFPDRKPFFFFLLPEYHRHDCIRVLCMFNIHVWKLSETVFNSWCCLESGKKSWFFLCFWTIIINITWI